MLNEYFGELGGGQLTTGRFVALWLIIIAAFFGFGLAIVAGIGIAEHIVGGDLASAQKIIRETLGLPAVVITIAMMFLFMFAKLNIIAKRARDIGLPGWLTAIILAGLMGGVSQTTGNTTAGGLGMILVIALALTPSNSFQRKG